MMKLIRLAAIAISSSAIANHVLAKEVIEGPRVQPKNFRSANQGIGSPKSSERSIVTVGNSTVWLAPIGHCQPRAADIPKSVRNSTVWLAPVGHCQPRAADIPKSSPEPEDSAILERENAFIDSKIGICRRC
jgi:hypothetical protein